MKRPSVVIDNPHKKPNCGCDLCVLIRYILYLEVTM